MTLSVASPAFAVVVNVPYNFTFSHLSGGSFKITGVNTPDVNTNSMRRLCISIAAHAQSATVSGRMPDTDYLVKLYQDNFFGNTLIATYNFTAYPSYKIYPSRTKVCTYGLDAYAGFGYYIQKTNYDGGLLMGSGTISYS